MASTVVELTPDGVPYYKWPPFPSPPPGVKITPFSEFKEQGIQIMMDDIHEEVDGLGVPTVTLAVKHNLDDSRKKKKKKTNANGEIIKQAWYEDWAEGEDLRRNHSYDPHISAMDRLVQASHDFMTGRQWPVGDISMQSMWDKFRNYIGVIGKNVPAYIKPKNVEPNDDDMDDEDSDSDDEAFAAKPQEPNVEALHKGQAIKASVSEILYDEAREGNSRNMGLFLGDPELSMKIYLSSYFREAGFIWDRSPVRLSYTPKLVLFFLNFLLRNRVLPGYQREITKAIAVAKQAEIELPQSKHIAMALPEKLGKMCENVWGGHEISWEDFEDREPAIEPTRNPDNKRVKLNDGTSLDILHVDLNEPAAKQVVKEQSVGNSPAKAPTGAAHGKAPSGWDVPSITEEEPSGWGASTGEPSGWGAPEAPMADNETGGWGAVEAPSWPAPEPNLFMELLGPSTFPLIYRPAYVESSTRRIMSYKIPTEQEKAKGGGDVWGSCASVVLAPWRDWGLEDKAFVKLPEIIVDPFAKNKGGPVMEEGLMRHDPMQDNIVVLMDPKAAQNLLNGMGLGGVFVQLIPQKIADSDEKRHGTGKGKKKKSGPDNKPFWYLEKSHQILTSFHTELAKRDE